MVENALNVMRHQSRDGHVSEMHKMAIGVGANYRSNFEPIKCKQNPSIYSRDVHSSTCAGESAKLYTAGNCPAFAAERTRSSSQRRK
jgi:hypothetical protein